MIYFGFHFFYHIPSESDVHIQYVSIHIKTPLIYVLLMYTVVQQCSALRQDSGS